jgi:hypothetical protein
MLHQRHNVCGFAGTKDKRGVTSQFVTLFKVEPARLAGLNPRWFCVCACASVSWCVLALCAHSDMAQGGVLPAFS